ncbi:helix-turn-helix domain-containing protein [Aurantiacibacter poecillastricola]|uniref:helix-turn-helix domain-containing protein n=1 Tax=Aurantiacibacter poecillastricola TaxID=3064385 RepID=UPI00273F242D|nr:helix-turn-helix domain-containing protein [Aurantiacibacter sp. 219JJ12-13]MDP5262412.1 helix-turn-helix domain-containing protein [Aurantiacibacter sp. 219JJ12-13]
MARSVSSIPSFGLFGEKVGDEIPDFFHWETIEARSAAYRWEIASHRHPHLFQVLFVKAGTAEIRVDAKTQALAAPALVFVPAGRTHGFRFSDPTDGLVMTGRVAFLRLLGPSDTLFLALQRPGLLTPSPAATDQLTGLADQMLASQANSADANGTALRAALAEAWLRLAAATREALEQPGGSSALVDRFKALVELHSHAHWTVQDYARELGCTARTLARATQEGLGLSPLQYINRRLASEARRLLNFTNANVVQVADALGFADPSYFSRFYLRMTGVRPSTERQGQTLGARPVGRC